MAVCPFCGNEVENFDFMCGKCGKALEPTAGAANLVSNYSNSMGDSAGYNPYAGNSAGGSGTGTGGGYNPYSGSSVDNGYNPYSGSSSGAGGGYNPYSGSNSGAGDSYNPYGGSGSGADNSYNPYGGSSSGADNSYNPYGGSSSGADNSYNPYGGSGSGADNSYNPYGGSSSGAGGGYNPYGGTGIGDDNSYNSYDNTYNPGGGSGGASGGYNPYSSGGTTGSGLGYNPYSNNSDNSKSASYSSADSLPRDTDSSNVGYEPSKYGAYDSSLDTSQNVDKVKKQKAKNQVSSFFKGVIVVAIIAVVIVIGYPMVKEAFGKPYESLVQKSMAAVEEQDYEKLQEILAIDYERMLRDIYGTQYDQALGVLKQQNAASVRNMKEKYGDDYTIKTSITKVKNMSGSLKQEAIDRAKTEYEVIFDVSNTNLNLGEYFKEEDITHIKRLRVKMTISGSKRTETNEYYVDIAKLDNGRGWRFMEAYEMAN